MKRILELTEKEFMTGIAPSSQVQNGGLFHRAPGITVTRNPFLESDDVGVLQLAPKPVDITGDVIEDTPFAWTIDQVDPDTGFAKLYIWGRDGWLYSIDFTGDFPPVNVNASMTPPVAEQAAGGTAANGLFLMNHSDGSKNVWYFRQSDIGYVGDLNGFPTFNSAVYASDIETTGDHPVHQLFDRRYFANGRYIGQIEDDGSGGLNVTGHALDLDIDDHVKCLSDDGTYLVAGVTKNTTSLARTDGHARIIFWDTNQSSWQREWPMPDTTIYSIKRVGAVMEAVTTKGIFAFTFSSPPQPVVPFFPSGSFVPEYAVPSQFAVDTFGEAVLIGGVNKLSTFGKITPAMPNAYFQPYAFPPDGDPDPATLVIANANTGRIFVGTLFEKLFRIDIAAAGEVDPDNLPAPAETIYIDLKRWYQIGRIVVGFDGQLAEDDDLSITLKPEDAGQEYSGGRASFDDNGAIRLKDMYCSLEARKLKLLINFLGGGPRIRTIEVWGDPIERPTHSRADVGVLVP